MGRIRIFTTDRNAALFDAFSHGETEYIFGLLTCKGPVQLVEGQPRAFVGWLLDECSGLELVRRLRSDERMRHAHITMLLDDDNAEDRRRALAAGADDYAHAPLDRQAMLDRVLALHEGGSGEIAERIVRLGDLAINVASEQARWKDRPVTLRPNELRVLRYMAENPARILSRQDLIDALGKNGDPDYLRTVDVWIKRLRAGLREVGAEQLLRTVHGRGYVLDLP